MTVRAVAATVLLGLGACSHPPPEAPDDVCAVFADRPLWYRSALAARRDWGLPLHVGMAFVHRESSYVSDARPPRRRLLWVIPWFRPSSAYGYAQATDAAWGDYQRTTRRSFADRYDFADALDFIGWYNQRSARTLGIRPDDAYRLYLAYYQGPGGYRRSGGRGTPEAQAYARKVAARAARYRAQLAGCEQHLGGGIWSWLS